MKKTKGQKPIASAILYALNKSSKIRIRIERPRSIRIDGPWKSSWRCRYSIKGATLDIQEEGGGVDSLQALLMALRGIEDNLRRCNMGITFIPDMDAGFPMIITENLGANQKLKIRKLINREIDVRLKSNLKHLRQVIGGHNRS